MRPDQLVFEWIPWRLHAKVPKKDAEAPRGELQHTAQEKLVLVVEVALGGTDGRAYWETVCHQHWTCSRNGNTGHEDPLNGGGCKMG